MQSAVIREEFLGFVQAERTTGQMLAEKFIESLVQYGIVVIKMRAQSYDAAQNMAGKHNGVQEIIHLQFTYTAELTV